MKQKLHGKRIFIAEDNAMNRVVYTMALRISGALLEFDRWGRETMWRIQGFNPDLIVLDLMLSKGASGYDVFEEIRKDSSYDHIPIVAISASEPAVALPKCRQMGFSGFIAKPIEEHLLADQMVRLIAGEQVWYLGERFGGDAGAIS